jgi:hypothetical protein
MELCWRSALYLSFCCAQPLFSVTGDNPDMTSYHRRIQFKNLYSFFL